MLNIKILYPIILNHIKGDANDKADNTGNKPCYDLITCSGWVIQWQLYIYGPATDLGDNQLSELLHVLLYSLFMVPRPEHSWTTGLIPRLLMPWLSMSPGHQQWCYWQSRVKISFSSIRKVFNNICLLSQTQIHIWLLFHFLQLIHHATG